MGGSVARGLPRSGAKTALFRPQFRRGAADIARRGRRRAAPPGQRRNSSYARPNSVGFPALIRRFRTLKSSE